MSIPLGQIVHSPADIFRYLLIQQGYGSLPNITSPQPWPITADTELDSPDNAITVTSTTGEIYGRVQVTGEHVEAFGIQVKVRSSYSTAGWTQVNAVAVGMDHTDIDNSLNYQLLTIPANVQQGTPTAIYTVQAVTRKGPVISLGREAGSSRRFLFTVNCIFTVQQVS